MSQATGTTANTKDKKATLPQIDFSKCATLQSYDIEEKLTTARIALMIKKPFFGQLATRMTIVRADDWLATAAVDGRNFYYNSAFIDHLSAAETEFLFGHEVLHLVFDHFLRRDDRDPQLYNIAADYVVNQTLVDENVGKFPTSVGGLLDSKYKGLISEEVYELLKKDQDKDQSIIDELIKQILDEHDPWAKDGDDDGEAKDCDACDGTGKDEHGGDCKECGGTGKKPSNGQPGAGKRPSEMTEAEKQDLKDELKDAILNAAWAAGAGNVPAGVQRLIDEMIDPQIDWRELLQQQIQSTRKSDFSFARPNRKGQMSGCILPGMIPEETIDICITIDMSGSISQKMATEFLSEVNGIMVEFQEFKIHLWTFDTKVYNPAQFTENNAHELLEYQCKGGGGTDFEVNWTWMKEQGIEPKKFIMFTDGEAFGSWGDENYCDTVFIINNSYNKNIKAPFGEQAYYNEEKND